MNAPRPSRFAQLADYVRALRELIPGRLGLAVAVLVLIGGLEYVSLALLLPIFHALGLGGASAPVSLGVALPSASLGVLLVGFVGLRVVQIALRAWSEVLSADIENGFITALRERFYRAMLEADWLHLSRQRSSDFTQALLEELPQAGLAARQVLQTLSVAVLGAVQLAIAFVLAPGFTALLVGAAVVVGLGWRALQRRAARDTGTELRADLAATVANHLGGLKIAKSYGRGDGHWAEFSRTLAAITKLRRHGARAGALLSFWQQTAVLAALVAFAYIALVVRPLALPSLALLAYLFSRLFGLAAQFQAGTQRILIALPSYAATEELRTRLVAAAEPPTHPAARLSLERELRFRGVSFRYAAERAPAVAEIDLALPARQVTALCGASGAGKSTLADLALGLLRPEAGGIFLDGQPLDAARLHAWRQSIGYVPQETFLFHDTVRANLLWARPDATESDLRAALRAAAAEEFVLRLPQGLDTIVGDRGQSVSGGERQRLALARALLRRPALLVLDEATSALDPHHERLVQDAIGRLRGETTILLIAHRLSTVRAADRIVVLAAGRIAETGTWAELAAREHGAFRALLAADART